MMKIEKIMLILIVTISLLSLPHLTQCQQVNITNVNNNNQYSIYKFPYTKYIWVYWDQNIQQAPLIVRLCLQKMKQVSIQQNWLLILLTDNNLHQYITNFDNQFLSVKNRMQHPQWKAGVADLVRLSVLSQHGGVWFDLSTILTHGLEWLSNLQNIPYLLTNSQIDQGQQPDLLVPYLNFYQSLSQQRDQQTGKLTKLLPGYQAWFIAAKKNTSIIKQWKQKYIQHITTREQVNRQHQIEKQYFTKSLKGEYLNVDKSINEIVQDRQKQIDMELGLFEKRRNVNRQLNIVGFHGEYGPFILYLNLIPDLDMAFTHTLQQLQNEFYITVNFFVKFTNKQRSHFDDKINRLIKLLNDKDSNGERIYKSFEEFMNSKPSEQQCKEIKFIVEGSIFGSLIKHNKVAQSYNLYPISKQEQYIWLSYCQDLLISSDKYKQNNTIILNRYSYEEQARIKNESDLQHFWNWLYNKQIISKQTRQEIIKYFVDIDWMGIMSIDLKELYYWKKVYSQDNNDNMGDKKDNGQKYLQDKDDFQIQMINNKNSNNKNNDRNKNKGQQVHDDNNYTDNINQNNQVTNLHSQQQRLLTNTNNDINNKWQKLSLNKKTHFYIQLFLAKIQPLVVKFWYLTQDFKPYIYQFIPIIVYGFLSIYLLLILLKFRLRYVNYIGKIVLYVLIKKQMDSQTQQVWFKIKDIFIKFKQSNKLNLILKIITKSITFIFKLILHFLLGLLFITFQLSIIIKFIRICLDADTDNQQLPLLTFLLIQILFRNIIYKWINKNAYFIPWIISLKLLYRIFLPIYYMCFGRCLVAFGQRRQDWNFGLMFTICLVFPIIVKEIQFQARKIVIKYKLTKNHCNYNKKYNNSQQQQRGQQSLIQYFFLRAKKLSITLIIILANLTDIIQILVIQFLLLTYLVPNIIYIYTGKQHFMKLLITKLAFNGGIVLLIILLGLYIMQIVSMFGQLVRECKMIVLYKSSEVDKNDNIGEIKNLQKVNRKIDRQQIQLQSQLGLSQLKENNVQPLNQEQQQNKQQQQQLTISKEQKLQYLPCDKHNNNNQINCNFQPSLIPHFITFITIVTKYSINLYLFYKLAIQPYPQIVYNNVLQIWKPKVSQVLLLIVINFQIQKVIDQLCCKVEYYFNTSEQSDNNCSEWWLTLVGLFKKVKKRIKRQKDSHNQLQKQQQKQQQVQNDLSNTTTQNQQKQRQQYLMDNQKINHFLNKNNCYIPVIGLYIFQVFRLQMFEYIFMYFDVIDQKRFDLRWQIQKKFPLYKQEIIYYTFAGYCFLVFVEMFIEQNGQKLKSYLIKKSSNKSDKRADKKDGLIVYNKWSEKQTLTIMKNINDDENNSNINLKNNKYKKRLTKKKTKSQQSNTIKQIQLSSYQLNKSINIQ